MDAPPSSSKKVKSVSYKKWGYIFTAPFFIAFGIFSLVPLIWTFYNSFFENYMVGLKHIGPSFVGFQNYVKVFVDSDLGKYLWNTVFIWIIGFIPQIILSLLLAALFTDLRLRLKAGFFKTVFYMPNLIMAASFSMLFFVLFSDAGPINTLLTSMGVTPVRFFTYPSTTRGLLAIMNTLLWFGNTTILLMAGIMGIDQSLIESAQIDGAKPFQVFRKITLPLMRPILIYVLINSMIGGLQLFDIPQILTNGEGIPDRTAMTLVMFLNKHLYSKNYGMAGAVSVIMFILTGILSFFVYRTLTQGSRKERSDGGIKKKRNKG
jgi:cellobiose transport system permease protein